MRWLYVLWLMVGVVLCHGQEMVDMALYDDLTLRVGKGEGVYVVDSADMVQMIGLLRSLKAEADACGGVADKVVDCDSLLRAGESIMNRERDIWKREVEMYSGRGDWYMERMKEEMRASKRVGVKWGMWGGAIGAVAGFVIGAVVIK